MVIDVRLDVEVYMSAVCCLEETMQQPITQLPPGVPQLIQSTISLPTYPSVLIELIHNAIDAKATQIDCWINPSAWSIRVTDNGIGIDKDDLKGGLGCEQGLTSKLAAGGELGDDSFLGFRGQGMSWSTCETCNNDHASSTRIDGNDCHS